MAYPMIASLDSDVAAALLAVIPDARARAMQINGGGNNCIYHVESTHGDYALKKYPCDDAVRQRQKTETAALAFLAYCGMRTVPQYYKSYGNFSLYAWIDGRQVVDANVDDLAQSVALLTELQSYSTTDKAQEFAPAYQACHSLQEIVLQIRTQYERLLKATADDELLQHSLVDTFENAISTMSARACNLYEKHALTSEMLDRSEQRLIHGDYGFHNILKDAKGQLHLIDFEYFGWDDPVKMVADFALHPGVPLLSEARASFLDQIYAQWKHERSACLRLHALLPLFAIRWACITLQPLLRDRSVEQGISRMGFEWERLKEQQLLKATSLITLCEHEGLL